MSDAVGVSDIGEPPLRVLLVDDTPVIRLILRRTLDRDGRFEVVGEACDGAEAISAAQHLQPDLVLLDLAMPVMDGLEALPQILAVTSSTKVVVLSAFNAAQMANLALRAGAVRYMQKDHLARVLVPMIMDVFDRPAQPDPVATA